jgi:uncharacterized protein (UPF0333 family)
MKLPVLLSVIGAITSWQAQLEFSLRILAALVAIIAGTPPAIRALHKAWQYVRGLMAKAPR